MQVKSEKALDLVALLGVLVWVAAVVMWWKAVFLFIGVWVVSGLVIYKTRSKKGVGFDL
jgi:hypothetical protein